MAAFSAPIDETSAFKLGNKFSHLLRHKITSEYFVASRELVDKSVGLQSAIFADTEAYGYIMITVIMGDTTVSRLVKAHEAAQR